MRASDRLACLGALPLLAHALSLRAGRGGGGGAGRGARRAPRLGRRPWCRRPRAAAGARRDACSPPAPPPPPPPAVALAAARAPLRRRALSGRAPFSVGGRWEAWMEARGLAAVRRAFHCSSRARRRARAPRPSSSVCLRQNSTRRQSRRTRVPAAPPRPPDQCARAPALRQRTLERLRYGCASARAAPTPSPPPRRCGSLTSPACSPTPSGRKRRRWWALSASSPLLVRGGGVGTGRAMGWPSISSLPSSRALRRRSRADASPSSASAARFSRGCSSPLVRSAQRFASAAPVGGAASFAPRLRKLCAAVRAHVLQPPPPPPPLRVLLHVPSGGTRVNLTVAKNVAPFNDAAATARTDGISCWKRRAPRGWRRWRCSRDCARCSTRSSCAR